MYDPKYCSLKCYYEYGNSINKQGDKNPNYGKQFAKPITCGLCGKPFHHRDNRTKYCSSECYLEVNRKLLKHIQGNKKGKTYVPHPRLNNYQKWWIAFFAYFKPEIIFEYSIIQIQLSLLKTNQPKFTERQKRNINRIKSRVRYHQEHVKKRQKEYRQTHKEQIRIADRAYRKANPDKQYKWKKIWKSRNPEKVKASKKNRDILKRGGLVTESINDLKVFIRDNWKCQICHKRVPKDKKVPHPMAATIDHIIPLAHNGTHEFKNVQLAHFICNSRKGVKAFNDQLRIF